MLRFYLSCLCFLLVLLLMFFHFGGKHYSYIRKESPADFWTPKAKLVWNRSFQYLFRVFGIGLFYFLYLPLVYDIPNMINNNYLEKTIVIEELARQNKYPTALIMQPLTVGEHEFLCFGFGFFEEGAKYQLKYLPESKFVLEAQQISE